MSDLVRRPDLLDANATPRERASVAVDGRLQDIDVDLVRRVRDPAAVPASHLPYLAWERSVDVYDPAWPEAVRRAAVAAAPIVHRYKGTRYALETALEALRVHAEIVEWWQASPRAAPYTFHLRAHARAPLYEGPVLDARLIRVVHATVMRVKPTSRSFTLTVVASLPAALGVAALLRARTVRRAALRPENREDFGQRLGLSPVAVARTRVCAALHAAP